MTSNLPAGFAKAAQDTIHRQYGPIFHLPGVAIGLHDTPLYRLPDVTEALCEKLAERGWVKLEDIDSIATALEVHKDMPMLVATTLCGGQRPLLVTTFVVFGFRLPHSFGRFAVRQYKTLGRLVQVRWQVVARNIG